MQIAEQPHHGRRHVDGLGRFGERHQRAVEVEEQGGVGRESGRRLHGGKTIADSRRAARRPMSPIELQQWGEGRRHRGDPRARRWPRRSSGRRRPPPALRARWVRWPPPAPRPGRASSRGRGGIGRVLQAEAPARVALAGQQRSRRSARGLRKASQRSSRRTMAAALSSPLRWMLPCSRATTSASSRQSTGTRQRSHTARSSRALRCSWPMWRGSTSAGVVPLPRSCTRQAKRTAQRRIQPRRHVEHHHQVHAGVDLGVVRLGLRHAPQAVDLGQQHAPARRIRAAPRTCARAWPPSGRARVPARRARAPAHRPRRPRPSRASAPWFPARPRNRRSARRSARRAGCAPGLRGRPRSRGAARLRRRSRWPSKGSTRSAGSTSSRSDAASLSAGSAIALIVRSRRARSCSSVTSGAAWKTKPW